MVSPVPTLAKSPEMSVSLIDGHTTMHLPLPVHRVLVDGHDEPPDPEELLQATNAPKAMDAAIQVPLTASLLITEGSAAPRTR